MATNPANGGFLLNMQRPETVTAGSETSGFEISYAFMENPTLKYKSGAESTTINITLTAVSEISGFALINCNLSAAAQIRFRYCSDGTFSTVIEEKTVSSTGGKNSYLVIDAPPSTKYLQLYISDPGNPPEIGVIYLGESFQFPHNYSWGYENEFCVAKEVDTTDEGVHFETPGPGEDPAPEWENFKLTFSRTDSQFRQQFFPLIRPSKKVFMPSYTQPECHYGIVPEKTLKSKRNRDGDTYTISFYEDSI